MCCVWLDEVPAHIISVSLFELTDGNNHSNTEVVNKLSIISHRLDLTEINEVESEAADLNNETSPLVNLDSSTSLGSFSQEEEQIDSASVARFQYDGVLIFEPKIKDSKDESGNCANYDITAIASGQSESFHVLTSKEEFGLEVLARQMIITPSQSATGEAVYCDVVRDTNITVTNNVGLVESNPNDAKTIAKLLSVDADISLYRKCTDGCILEVNSEDTDITTTTDIRSFAHVQLRVGNPEVNVKPSDPHLHAKTIIIQSGQSRHTMWVVVTGQYSEGPPNR